MQLKVPTKVSEVFKAEKSNFDRDMPEEWTLGFPHMHNGYPAFWTEIKVRRDQLPGAYALFERNMPWKTRLHDMSQSIFGAITLNRLVPLPSSEADNNIIRVCATALQPTVECRCSVMWVWSMHFCAAYCFPGIYLFRHFAMRAIGNFKLPFQWFYSVLHIWRRIKLKRKA